MCKVLFVRTFILSHCKNNSILFIQRSVNLKNTNYISFEYFIYGVNKARKNQKI